LSDVDRPERTPERIYNWQDSQLSIARRYGECRFNGAVYFVAYDEEGKPLVRADVVKRERRTNRKQLRMDV
jgi:hypothetical protein